MNKTVKIEWCRNWIKAQFEKIAPYGNGIADFCFWEMAERAGLYEKGQYGVPMTHALSQLCDTYTVTDDKGNFKYHAFKLKGTPCRENERCLA